MFPELSASRTQRTVTATQRVLRALHLDGPLIAGLGVLACMGLFVLYSAAGENIGLWTSQAVRLGIATAAMVALAQVPPHFLRMLAPAAYTVGVLLLIAVPRSGCSAISSTGTSTSSSAPRVWGTDGGSGRSCRYQATIIGRAIFMISEGWKRRNPRSSQRCAPMLTSPTTATATSSSTPTV